MPRRVNDANVSVNHFTTGEVAKLCRLSQQTIIRCFDRGLIRGVRYHGTGRRYIPHDEVVRFMREHNLSASDSDSTKHRVLLIGDDKHVLLGLSESQQYEVYSANTPFGAGLIMERTKPHVVVLNQTLPVFDAELICQRLRATRDPISTKVIIVFEKLHQHDIDALTQVGAHAFLKKPVSVETFERQIAAVL